MQTQADKLKVGDLVRYKHIPEAVGLVLSFSDVRSDDNVYVQWNNMISGKRRWYVSPDWIEKFTK